MRLFSKAGKNIEKTIGDNSGEDNEGAEDSDDTDFELKNTCHTSYAEFSAPANTIVFKEGVQYYAVHCSFKSTLCLSIFAPPPNMV